MNLNTLGLGAIITTPVLTLGYARQEFHYNRAQYLNCKVFRTFAFQLSLLRFKINL